MLNRRKVSFILSAAAGAVLLSATAAIAYVIITGNGNSVSTGAVSTTQSISVTVGTVSNLVPGTAATNVPVTVQNTGNAKVQVNSVSLTVVGFTPAAATVNGTSCGTTQVTSGAVYDTIDVTSPVNSTDVLSKNDNAAGGTDQTIRTGTLSVEDSSSVNQNCLVGASIELRAGVNGG